MLVHHARLILGDAYASWEGGDILGALSYVTADLEFAVHASSDAGSLVGTGSGRDEFGRRLESFLRQFEVKAFALQQVSVKGLWVQSRASFRYRHRASGMEVDGAMRHKWRFVGDEIAHFELFHDSERMRAFYKMAAAA